MHKRQFARALPIAILLGGYALRLFRLGADSLWYDETVSLLLARSGLAELTRHTAGDIHPPLYYYLLHFWGQLTGWSEFSSAFLSLLFGVLLIALVFRFTREWLTPSFNLSPIPSRAVPTGEGVTLVAAFLVAVSPYNVWYSQEVRMYTIGAALGLVSVHFLKRILNAQKQSYRDFLAYVVSTVLGIYTLYYFVFLLVFEYFFVAAWLALRSSRHDALPRSTSEGTSDKRGFEPDQVPGRTLGSMRSQLEEWRAGSPIPIFAASQVVIAILYLPWLPIAFRQATDPPVPPWRDFTPLPNMLGESFSALVLGQSVAPLLVAPFLILVLALILYLFIRPMILARTSLASRATRQSPPSILQPPTSTAIFLLSYTLVPLLAIFVVSLWKPLYHVRYVFTYSPAFYILLALAICFAGRQFSRRGSNSQTLLTIGAVVVYAFASAYSLGNFWFDPRYAEDDLRGAVQYLAENWRPGDAILVNAGYAYPAFSYYYSTPLAARVRLVNYQPTPGDAQTAPIVLMTGSIDGSSRLGWGDSLSDFYATTADETTAALDRVFRSHPRVWMLRIYDTVTDPSGVIRKYFADQARLIDDQAFTGESNVRVQGFLTQRTTALPAGATRSDARLDDRVILLGFERASLQKRGGDTFDATLFWQPLQTLDQNYHLSLQVLAANGKLVAQHDETPLGDVLPTSRWQLGEMFREPVRVVLPKDVVPGEYSVIVKLYNLSTGEVLGDPISLGSLAVSP